MINKLVGFGLYLLIFAACNQERPPCLEPANVSLKVGCYKGAVNGKAVADTALPNPLIAGLFADSLRFWIAGVHNIQNFPLLLNPNADSCRWIVQTDSSITIPDTITFFYQRKLQFLSNACGYTYYFSLQNVITTLHSIDSAIVKDGEVSGNANTQHLRLYF